MSLHNEETQVGKSLAGSMTSLCHNVTEDGTEEFRTKLTLPPFVASPSHSFLYHTPRNSQSLCSLKTQLKSSSISLTDLLFQGPKFPFNFHTFHSRYK